MKTIYLIGFMGSGKSTVGKMLGEQLGIPFLDTDQMVESEYGPISAIFRDKGEKAFRTYETEMLKRIPDNNHIVSTGGGIVEQEQNIAFMNGNGIIFHLNASMNEIASRLGNDPNRPLWGTNYAERVRLYNRRKELYIAAADVTILTDGKTAQNITEEISSQLR
ncbi:shikimate kinase [Lentibacillus cibarius]|uniref:Shikimate kinase n=1 Tax=Lentibacillus cibarius TaxID=2583219 RepID=A0A5S3QGF1_9BACI|nr:shikimate kinase [Lentibacillus cibarius]TMN20799.1 shikimate kinase [Lentibacillus cibarius]